MKIIKYFFLIVLIVNFPMANAKDGVKKEIIVQFHWKHQFEFAGFYMAKKNGYYHDLNLNVNFKQWDSNVNIIDDVLSGKTNFAITRASSLIDISNNKQIIYLASIFQSSPLIILADKSSNIKSIKEFKNKKIMIAKNHLHDPSLSSMLSANGIKFEDLEFVEHSFNPKNLLDKKADLMVAYVSNEPFTLKELKGESVIFNPKDYGFDFYADLLITSKSYLKKHPQAVRDFKNATIKGFEYAFNNIDESVEYIYQKYNSQNKSKEALRYEAFELKHDLYDELNQIGNIKSEKLERIYDVYKLLGLGKNKIDFSKIIYKDINKDIILNEEEELYLQNKTSINICIDPNWMPFDKIDKKGSYIGIGSNYFDTFSKFLGVKFNVVKSSSWGESLKLAKEKKCDLLSLSLKSQDRFSYLNFTSAYVEVPIVAVTKLNIPFINGIKDLKNKPIGIVQDYALSKVIEKLSTNLNIIKVKSIQEGLRKTKKGELFAFIDTLPTIAYELQSNQLVDLKISGKLYDDIKLHLGVRKDDETLLNIMQKAINKITKKEHQDILSKWIAVKYESYISYKLIWQILFAFAFIITIIILWNRKIAHKNKLLKDARDEIEEKNKKLMLLATTDKLTSIFNRVKLDELLEAEISKFKRFNHDLCICILDIDHFKNVNDTYGHLIGDEVLKDIALILKQSLRKTDYVGRWGGEEFLMIFTGCNYENLQKVISSIREKIKAHVFVNNIKITASFGCSVYNNEDSISSLIKRADDALYKAKQTGRDKIILS